MLPHRISSSNDIVELIDPVVARRVPFFLPRDPIVHDALTVFEQPDANNEEVVPKEPQSLRHVSINNVDKHVAKLALLICRPAPARVAVCQTSAKFDGINREEVKPELAAVFRFGMNKANRVSTLPLHSTLASCRYSASACLCPHWFMTSIQGPVVRPGPCCFNLHWPNQ
jgi:hypothetical protein